MTLVSKKRSQSASEISSNGLGSKIPKLLTRMSTSGTCLTSPAAPSAVDRSAATPSTSAVPVPAVLRSRSTAALTRSALRPLTMIDAPSRTSPAATAKPIPAVEPVISARFPRSRRSIGYSSRTTLILVKTFTYISRCHLRPASAHGPPEPPLHTIADLDPIALESQFGSVIERSQNPCLGVIDQISAVHDGMDPDEIAPVRFQGDRLLPYHETASSRATRNHR